MVLFYILLTKLSIPEADFASAVVVRLVDSPKREEVEWNPKAGTIFQRGHTKGSRWLDKQRVVAKDENLKSSASMNKQIQHYSYLSLFFSCLTVNDSTLKQPQAVEVQVVYANTSFFLHNKGWCDVGKRVTKQSGAEESDLRGGGALSDYVQFR